MYVGSIGHADQFAFVFATNYKSIKGTGGRTDDVWQVDDKEKFALDVKTNMCPRHRDTVCALNWMRISTAYYMMMMMQLRIAQRPESSVQKKWR